MSALESQSTLVAHGNSGALVQFSAGANIATALLAAGDQRGRESCEYFD